MELPEETEKLLKSYMSPESSGLSDPPYTLVENARWRLSLKQTAASNNDLIGMIALFLNMKVKLYQAVLVMIVFFLMLFLFIRPGKIKSNEAFSSRSVSGLAATDNATVLPCIQTFIYRK